MPVNRTAGALALAIVIAGPSGAAEVDQAEVAEARQIVKSFMTDLKGRLQGAMKEAGPVHAVDVCHVEAPQIAAEAEEASGWSVARTSLKVRNQDNAPDAWEREILKEFADRMAAGEDPARIEHTEVVERDGGKRLRYMKAIPTGQVCVTCHGANLDAELAAKLDELYPKDQARGFHVGELRGAFTLSRPLDE